MATFPLAAIGEVAHVQSGYAFKSGDWQTHGIPVVRIANVKAGSVDLTSCAYVSPEIAEAASRYRLRHGDILVSMTGYIGEIARVRTSQHIMLNQRVGRFEITDADRLLSDYFFYALQQDSLVKEMQAHAYGVAQPNISPTLIHGLNIYLPPFSTQLKIVAILSTYDDLIENNLRRIKILEEMVQNLYREWFVKFRFPGHQHVCLTDSPLGRIPEEWEVASISDVAIIYRGRSYKGTELAEEGGRPFVNLKCIERDGGFRSSGLKRYTGPFKDTHTVRAGEMVMAITDMTQERRIVARVGRVSRLDADFGVISMDLVRVASRDNLSEIYLYAMLRWSGFADEVKQHANGVNVLHLLPDRIEEYRFVCPTSDIAARFGEVALPMLSLCDSLEQKNGTLRRSRDLLLPRLISGEVDVSELEIAVPGEVRA